MPEFEREEYEIRLNNENHQDTIEWPGLARQKIGPGLPGPARHSFKISLVRHLCGLLPRDVPLVARDRGKEPLQRGRRRWLWVRRLRVLGRCPPRAAQVGRSRTETEF